MGENGIAVAWKGPVECRSCSIRDLVLFADLTEHDFTPVHARIDEILYAPGAPLYESGQTGHHVFTLRGGLVKLVQCAPDGTQRVVRLLRPSAIAGLESLLARPYEHTAIALRPTSACRIPVPVINDLKARIPNLQRRLLERWHQSLHDADEWLTRLSTGSARARMARLLLRLPTCEDGLCEVFSREDLGAMLGITTETASRIIADFRRTGVVSEMGQNRFKCRTDALNLIATDKNRECAKLGGSAA